MGCFLGLYSTDESSSALIIKELGIEYAIVGELPTYDSQVHPTLMGRQTVLSSDDCAAHLLNLSFFVAHHHKSLSLGFAAVSACLSVLCTHKVHPVV